MSLHIDKLFELSLPYVHGIRPIDDSRFLAIVIEPNGPKIAVLDRRGNVLIERSWEVPLAGGFVDVGSSDLFGILDHYTPETGSFRLRWLDHSLTTIALIAVPFYWINQITSFSDKSAYLVSGLRYEEPSDIFRQRQQACIITKHDSRCTFIDASIATCLGQHGHVWKSDESLVCGTIYRDGLLEPREIYDGYDNSMDYIIYNNEYLWINSAGLGKVRFSPRNFDHRWFEGEGEPAGGIKTASGAGIVAAGSSGGRVEVFDTDTGLSERLTLEQRGSILSLCVVETAEMAYMATVSRAVGMRDKHIRNIDYFMIC